MKTDLIGKAFSTQFIVDPTMAAILDDKQIHPVCSTVTMVYYAELASRKVIEPYFEEHENAIGGGIALQHIDMAAIGEIIEMKAEIVSFDGKTLLCEFEGRLKKDHTILCKGNMTQYVLKQEIITELIEKSYKRIE
ncbi:MAG: hypothetical protein EBU66_06675 [Bacteroidetes bacterium]|nr:hypothetical protein [bacterium]NBP64344.1 hypothetical protein [Bacteroidota bacterium]